MNISKEILIEYSQCLIGAQFSSKSFGIGKCVDVEEKRIYIDFEIKGLKKIGFPEPLLDGRIQLINQEEVLKQIKTMRLHEGTENIGKTIKRRKIDNFVHFTRISNLKSIFQHGLCSIDYMISNGISYYSNDAQRLDGRTDAISLSVTFPNYKNFYKYYQNESGQWCFILLDPQKVILLDCAYFWTNAANSIFRGKKWESFKNRIAFDRMFENDRRSKLIPDSYTTDPQAEIMVKGVIPIDFFNGIVFDRIPSDVAEFPCKTMIDYDYFDRRIDFKEWSQGNYGFI